MATRYTPEFWTWASAHGLPPRGPRGSPINIVRKKITPTLLQRWNIDHAEKHDGT